jgi:hypothetical protein
VAQAAATCSTLFLACGFFYPEDGGNTFLRNVGLYKIYTVTHPRRLYSSMTKKITNFWDDILLSGRHEYIPFQGNSCMILHFPGDGGIRIARNID